MKNWSKKISAAVISIIPLLAAIVPHPAFASLNPFTQENFFWLMSWITSFEQTIAGVLLAISASLLNVTMTATLHMSAIVDETPAIGTAWTTVRDFGSVFIIFMLLYASIKMILGADSGIGKLIKNIVIAGLLINFSLFFTKLAVDASNIISLSFYSAIAPTGLGQTGNTTVAQTTTESGSIVGTVSAALNDGGLSNVFMQSLDLQALVSSGAAINSSNQYENIALAQGGASVIMFFAAISFLVAALAFAVRIGVLILLMAFSPIYFISMIFPDLKQYGDKWTKMLYSMCIFMPVYLFLMYVAMSVLNDPNFFAFAKLSQSATNITGTGGAGFAASIVGPNLIGTVLQYIIAIFLINAPLMAAISVAGEGADFMSKMMKNVSKWGQGAITNSQAFAAQHTAGRFAKGVADSKTFSGFAKRNPNLGLVAGSALKKVSGATFAGSKGGYDKRAKDHAEALTKQGETVKATRSTRVLLDAKIKENRAAKKKALEDIEKLKDTWFENGLSKDEYDRQRKALSDQIVGIDAAHDTYTDPKKKGDVLDNLAKGEYAESLGKSSEAIASKLFGTSAARKSAAKKTRDKIKDGPEKKRLEKMFADMMKESASDEAKTEGESKK